MLTVVWNRHGFHLVKILPRGQKWTSEYYIDCVLPEICFLHGAGDRRRLVVHADNAKPHVAKRIKQFLHDHNLRTAPHPLYSQDLAASDLFLFGDVERLLQGAEFATAEEPLGSVVKIPSGIRGEIFIATFRQWMERLQACIDCGGEYVESTVFFANNLLESQRETEMRDNDISPPTEMGRPTQSR
jgi:hypothetical protein